LSVFVATGVAGCRDESPLTDASVADMSDDCIDRGSDPSDGGTCLRSVTGQLVDDKGAVLNGIPVSVCGIACFFGRSGADGTFAVDIRSIVAFDRYALDVDGRPDLTSQYIPLPERDSNDHANFPAPIVVLHAPTSGTDLVLDGSKAQSVTSGDVTLSLPIDCLVEPDVEDVDAPTGHQFRALRAANPSALAFIEPANPPDLLYSLAPFEAQLTCPGALRVANTPGWPAGTTVDVYSMHGLIDTVPPAGGFDKIATAHVASDGSAIVTDAGQGVTALTWIALRRVP
jgi:hypothetical protein